MRKKYESSVKWVLKFFILVCVFIFILSIRELVVEKMEDIKAKKQFQEWCKQSVPGTTRGIHTDTVKSDTIKK